MGAVSRLGVVLVVAMVAGPAAIAPRVAAAANAPRRRPSVGGRDDTGDRGRRRDRMCRGRERHGPLLGLELLRLGRPDGRRRVGVGGPGGRQGHHRCDGDLAAEHGVCRATHRSRRVLGRQRGRRARRREVRGIARADARQWVDDCGRDRGLEPRVCAAAERNRGVLGLRRGRRARGPQDPGVRGAGPDTRPDERHGDQRRRQPHLRAAARPDRALLGGEHRRSAGQRLSRDRLADTGRREGAARRRQPRERRPHVVCRAEQWDTSCAGAPTASVSSATRTRPMERTAYRSK